MSEDQRHRSRGEDRDKDRHRDKRRDRDRDRDREERDRDREKERDRRDREKEKEKEKEKRDRDREREEREKEKEREREREREREKERERERQREREREREREEREREKERLRRREEREREREDRERERERRDRDKRRDRDLERDRDEDKEDSRDHERKRRRREDSSDRGRSWAERHKDDGSGSRKRRSEEEADAEEEEKKKKKQTREEDMEEEQRKLDEEMDKRRRRVHEWQLLKKKKEEDEREKTGAVDPEAGAKAGKNWTLDGESDDEESGALIVSDNDVDMDEDPSKVKSSDNVAMAVDSEKENFLANGVDLTNGDGESEIDPLDAYMNSMILPEVKKLEEENSVAMVDVDKNADAENKKAVKGLSNGTRSKDKKNNIGRIIQGEDSESDFEEQANIGVPSEEEDDEEFLKRVKKTKAEKLSVVDHSKIEYSPFKKNFYIEVKEIAKMTPEDVMAYRSQNELKVRGKEVPKPIKTWVQTGLTSKLLDTIKKLGFEKPMSIQAQALPVIMSGRDCIGIAKTGSGKTLAFVLPMLRHIKDQPTVVSGDGPIGLIMAPTRELVQQIHSDIKKFSRALGITCVPVYGGSGVAQQISDLKRGTEIVVCTPGRMIDILCTSAGKITNLRRVTYLVLDEADRMFDMGFEPQITRIVQNIRPDRQTVLFSATFPRQVEILARKVLIKPVEILVGGRSVVNKDITQLVEVRQESERLLRLLELLGEWHDKGKILVFVHSQEKCDALFKDLLKYGYPCLSLHGAKDQTDRESTISDFKSNVCNLLIATSIAARGLDVKELELVVNFDVPNHYEDYVHRVGRTGRAGRKGFAVTFISEEEARYAPDLVKALELSEQAIPADLKALADGFMEKVKKGTELLHGTGYGGSGFKFNEDEDEARRAAKKAQAREYGFEEDKSSDSEDEGVRKAGGDLSQIAAAAQVAAIAAAAMNTNTLTTATTFAPSPLLAISGPSSDTLLNVSGLTSSATVALDRAIAAAHNLHANLAKLQAESMPEHYEAELEINDFPQNARWKITHKETLGPVSDHYGVAITTRGQYYQPGRIPGPGERKLYLFIEGSAETDVKKAKAEVKRLLEDFLNQSLSLPGAIQPGKYSVL